MHSEILSLIAVFFIGLILGTVPVRAETAEEAFARAVQAVHDGEDERAINILRPLAEQGDPKGMSLLGWLLIASPVEQTKKMGLRWLLKAADRGDPNAMAEIAAQGEFAKKELGVTSEMLGDFLMKSAKKGHPQAQLLLGLFFLSEDQSGAAGDVFERDIGKSRYWLEESLKNGELGAKEGLFILNYVPINWEDKGKGNLVRDLTELSKEGYAYISFYMGQMYMGNQDNNWGAFDYPKAAKWFWVAALINNGFSDAVAYIEKIERVIGGTGGMADDWFHEHANDRGTRFGEAARWCVRQMTSDIRCLESAIYHHLGCLQPYFPGFFKNYYSSKGYDKCRKNQLAED